MSSYLKTAISSIYSEKDDFIIIGLTGRTGSGCTTAAKKLSSDINKIRHSLFDGDNPANNEQRKQKIIIKRARKIWKRFIHIQASSIITLILLKSESKEIEELLKSQSIDEEKIKKILNEKIDLNEPTKETTLDETIKFYTETIVEKHQKIKEILGKKFIKAYQEIGKNIRNSGGISTIPPQKSQEFTKISESIDGIIKEIRRKSKKEQEDKRTYIVIDAIRNQFEATYFQDRYSSFYLIAITCSEEDRRKRLTAIGYSDEEVNRIDADEHSEDPIAFDKPDAYMKQDIASCLQRADIYIHNPNVPNTASEHFELSNQLITFVTLMVHPGLITPSAIERCMQIAYTAKLNSGCISRQVGAAITDNSYSIKAIGWNDAPEGQVPCNLRNRSDLISGRDQPAFSDYEKGNADFRDYIITSTREYQTIWENTGRNLSFCFKSEYNKFTNKNNQVHTRALHAEENAFLQLAKNGGTPIKGGKLFTTASPCELCSKKAYQLGISEIYFIDPYPGIATKHTLTGGSNNPKLILFKGAIGRAFHNLYTPKLPYKDELATLAKSR